MKILCLSSYPVDEPRHGGQHRLSNIIKLFRAYGHEVCSAGVLGSAAYPESRFFVPYPGNEVFSRMIEHYSFIEDLLISDLFGVEGSYYTSLSQKIRMSPDVIYVEQPWMFRFAELFNQKRCGGRATIFYGSANIEYRLKTDILRRYYGEAHVKESAERVLACEVYALKQATRSFCVSEGDLEWSSQYTRLTPLLAPNGVADRRASMADIAAANQITQGRKFALYCASAHPPNMEGFFDLFGDGAGCFPPAARMVVAGGAGRSIAHDPRLKRTGSLQRQFIDAGEVSEEVLRGLLATAHQVVLPITAGGGTNLKTAEAIWSGRHVVATSKAMRGFEQFAGVRGVRIGDDGPRFCNAIRETFLLPNLSLSIEERADRSIVLWEHALAVMAETMNNAKLARQ